MFGFFQKKPPKRKRGAERSPTIAEMIELSNRKASEEEKKNGDEKKPRKRKTGEVSRRGDFAKSWKSSKRTKELSELKAKRRRSQIAKARIRRRMLIGELDEEVAAQLRAEKARRLRRKAIHRVLKQDRRAEIRHKQRLLRDIVHFEKRRQKATQNRHLCCRICCCCCFLCCCRRRMDAESVEKRLHKLRVAEYRRRLRRKDQRRIQLKKMSRRYAWARRQPMTFGEKLRHYRRVFYNLYNFCRIRPEKPKKLKLPIRRLTPYSPPQRFRRIPQPAKRPKRQRKVGEWRFVAHLKNTRNECMVIWREWRKSVRAEKADKAAATRGNVMIPKEEFIRLKRSFVRKQLSIPAFGTKPKNPKKRAAAKPAEKTGQLTVVAEVHANPCEDNEEISREESPIHRANSEPTLNHGTLLPPKYLSQSLDLWMFHISTTNINSSIASTLAADQKSSDDGTPEIVTSSDLREKIRAAFRDANTPEPCSSATALARDARFREAVAVMKREIWANRDPFMLRKRFHLEAEIPKEVCGMEIDAANSRGDTQKCIEQSSEKNSQRKVSVQRPKPPYPVDYSHEDRYRIPSPGFSPKTQRRHEANLRHYSQRNPHFLKLPQFYDDPLEGRPLPYRRYIPPPLPPPYLDPYRFNRPPLQGCEPPPPVPWQKEWRGNFVQLTIAQISQSNEKRKRALRNAKESVENRHFSYYAEPRDAEWRPDDRGIVPMLRYFVDSVRRQRAAIRANRKPRMPTQAEKEFILGTRKHYDLANMEGFKFSGIK